MNSKILKANELLRNYAVPSNVKRKLKFNKKFLDTLSEYERKTIHDMFEHYKKQSKYPDLDGKRLDFFQKRFYNTRKAEPKPTCCPTCGQALPKNEEFLPTSSEFSSYTSTKDSFYRGLGLEHSTRKSFLPRGPRK